GSLSHDKPMSAVLTGKRNALVSSLLGGIRAHGGKPKFKKKTGSADMNILADWGCPIVAYGPGDSSLDHTSEEHILISDYEKSISILKTSLSKIV
ncbi:MAG: acetyl-lysine deacetylase, partial [Flavobacteriaceae bacterium]|nr:acetyl-lysine deacetylase [Flavobacteriaceae bacterium]